MDKFCVYGRRSVKMAAMQVFDVATVLDWPVCSGRWWYSAMRLTFVLAVSIFANLDTIALCRAAQGDGDDAQPSGSSLCGSTHRSGKYTSLEAALEAANDALSMEECATDAIVVYTARAEDDGKGWVRGRLAYIGGGRGGYYPFVLKVGETIAMRVSVRRSQAFELNVQASGYQQVVRRTIVRCGEVAVWDDVVLRGITPETAASLAGRVWLEDDMDADGMVILVDGDHAAIVDEDGYFNVDQISTGNVSVSSYVSGYHGMRSEIVAKPRELAVCELRGYKDRYARVRWEYQPEATRDFRGGTVSGEATFARRELDRVSFSHGFSQVSGYSDFFVRNERDKLILSNLDVRGRGGPGFQRLRGVRLDDVTEAPEKGYRYPSPALALHVGDVFVFRCYDGEHYGKFEVLDITTDPPPPDYGD